MVDPNPEVSGQGMEKFNQVNIETASSLMEREARALNPGFIRRMETGQPFVRCKLAMSLDGRTALANGESQWITSAEARRDVHRLRAESSAIITGIGTVLADDPSMTVRDFDEDYQQPIKVIIDTRLEIPVTARMLTLEGRTLIMTQSVDEGKKSALTQAGAEVVVLAKSDEGTWLKSVLQYLAEKEQINEIMLEAGASLSGSFIQAGLVNEMIIYMAAKLMGNDAKPLLQLKQFEQLSDCPELNIIDVRNIGRDIRIQVSLMCDD